MIVAVHGGPGSHRDFRHLAEALQNSPKHQLVRPDLPGYGASKRHASFVPSTVNFAAAMTETLAQIAAKGGAKKKRVVVLGHSLGGHIALEMAASSGGAVDGVVLLASVSCRPHKALGGEHGYKIARWLGLNAYHPVFGGAIRLYLEFLYKRILGFPKVRAYPFG